MIRSERAISLLTGLLRMSVVLGIMLAAAGMMAWYFAPDIKSIRPEVETYLTEEIGLKKLALGDLSWHWGIQFGLTAKGSSFESGDNRFAVDDSDITVAFSLLDFLTGTVVPSTVQLRGGRIGIVLEHTAGPPAMPFPDTVVMKSVTLDWRYGDLSGQLEQFGMQFDSGEKKLRMTIPGTGMTIAIGDNGVPSYLDIRFSNLQWLPREWRHYVNGAVAGEAKVRQPDVGKWQIDFAIRSGESSGVNLVLSDSEWPLAEVSGEVTVLREKGEVAVNRIHAEKISWSLGRNSIDAVAEWNRGKVSIQASSPYMAMPLIWQGLKPLGSGGWHRWLSSMKHGVATEAKATVSFPWALPWEALPAATELDSLQYRVHSHVSDADIALGLGGDFLTATEANVDLDEKGLEAAISSAKLPKDIGAAHGKLVIPWQTLVLDIAAAGDVDTGRLVDWFAEDGESMLKWRRAPSKGKLSMAWDPSRNRPDSVEVDLTPVTPWKLRFNNSDISVDSGDVHWSYRDGIRIAGMNWSSSLMSGTTDLQAIDENGLWKVVAMNTQSRGEFSKLIDYFMLPVEGARGEVISSIVIDGKIKGSFDLTAAGWDNLLGTTKRPDEPFSVEYDGKSGSKLGQQALLFENIGIVSDLIHLAGSGSLSSRGLQLSFDKIRSSDFDGAIGIEAPFGPEPWELEVMGSYLNRNALPAIMTRKGHEIEKPWSLQANIDRFVWNRADIGGAFIQFSSAANSTGILRASTLKTSDLAMHGLSATFKLPGEGKVDLLELKAGMNEMNLNLSATLMPDSGDAMKWNGFAKLEGNFGDMMKRADISEIFKDGEMQILFSGQGRLFGEDVWWKGLNGRLRVRVDDGHILKGGTLSKLLAAFSIADLPSLLVGQRKDLTSPGLGYKRMQVEAVMRGKDVDIHKLAMRAAAMDMAGKGKMDIEKYEVDMTLVMRPLQNLDAILSKIPIVRDMFGGAAHSFLRKVYRMHGPIVDAKVDEISPKEAGLEAPGLFDLLLNLPQHWFGRESAPEATDGATP